MVKIGFSRSTKHNALFSKGIQWWDGTNYSHVYFVFKSEKYNVEMVYQASSTMLNYMSKPVFLKNNEIVHEISLQLTEEQFYDLMKTCMESAGLEYGTKQVIGVVLADMFKLKENPFSDDEKYHCSEWVAERLEKIGYKFNKPLDLVKPVDIFKVFNQ